MRRKGISALIATVLLTAFTLAVSGLLVTWITTFTQDTTAAIGDESQRLIDCSYAGISIYTASYNGRFVNVSVQNTGRTSIGNLTLAAIRGGSVQARLTTSQTAAPGAGELRSYGLAVNTRPDEIRISSTACPEIGDIDPTIGDG